MIVSAITDLIAKTHPLLVHLPIGILLLAMAMYWMSRMPRFAGFSAAVPFMFLAGTFSAALSCISGWLLRNSGSYEEPLVLQHQYAGISVLVISSLVTLLQYRKATLSQTKFFTSLLLLPALVLAGHWGGSLTHGEDYLGAALATEGAIKPALPPIDNIGKAKAYNDLVMPLLAKRCYNCHGEKKQKGDLRLDGLDYMLKGGENGAVFTAGEPANSLMLTRMLLPKDNDKHMPPRQQPQLTADEIALLHWWIANGADADKTVEAIPQTAEDLLMLEALASGNHRLLPKTGAASRLPDEEVDAANAKSLSALRALGVTILPVGNDNNFLAVNVMQPDSLLPKIMEQLPALKAQIVWLYLAYQAVDDDMLQTIGKLDNITRLNLAGTDITDSGLVHLKNLKQLQWLNLYNTAINGSGLQALAALPRLKQVYCYKTKMNATQYAAIKTMMPQCIIDTGGYAVPTLPQDTTMVKAE